MFMARAKTVKKAGAPAPEMPAKKKATGDRRDYSVNEVYEEGEIIYHKIWDDVGEIMEVGTTEDGVRKMKVHFEKVGVKNLRMG
jgi:hypothetical protein